MSPLFRTYVRNLGLEGDLMEKGTPVYLNGKLIGFHKKPKELVMALKELRRKNEISNEVNVYYKVQTDEVFINTNQGRIRRPYFVVQNGKTLLNEEIKRRIKEGKLTWNTISTMSTRKM